jgi:imidazole glycerol phosphate synthase glutamine amidotransferase subunit
VKAGAQRATGGGPRIAVVDYGAGNMVSIEQALTTLGADVTIARDGTALRGADGVVVPGVGAAAPAMVRLDRYGLTAPLRAWIDADRPFLGICLGLQLLFERSDEDGAETFGVIRGRTARLEDAPTLPHIGWNQVVRRREHRLFDGIANGADFYFVHSYAGLPEGGAADAVLATTEHGATFPSAIERGRLLGVQFHPERSGTDGLRLLSNFLALVRASAEAVAA